ncbi:MAG: hypothetical protein SGARI_001763 [Bacillariaceae sp.]
MTKLETCFWLAIFHFLSTSSVASTVYSSTASADCHKFAEQAGRKSIMSLLNKMLKELSDESPKTGDEECNMDTFATLSTPSGFPMPDIPRKTDRRGFSNNRENDVDECVQKILLQEDWTSKIFDEEAIKEWSEEYWSCQNDGILRYAVDECRWRHEAWKDRVGTPVVICKAGPVLARDDTSQELRASMMNDLKFLRQEEEESMSTMARHPKYEKILHLVHPSLYAYEKGVTHVLPDADAEAVKSPSWDKFLGFGGITNTDKPFRTDEKGLRNDPMYSNPYRRFKQEPPTAAECSQYQWLPSEFFVASGTENTVPTCCINSYINNLHPIKYKGLYDKIGDLFVEALPVMEELLSEVNDEGNVRKQKPRFIATERSRRRESAAIPKVELPVPWFSPPTYTSQKQTVALHDRPLQVIVKLISMELKPEEEHDYDAMTREERMEHYRREEPHFFEGGHWHVEGTLDERIVASACCYLDSENVRERGLEFRDGSVGSTGKELGTAATFPGRILVWPNYLHHKTGSVSLVDKTKPGHRTLCCFHLVDPTLRVRSTATVPPQQRSWLSDLVTLIPAAATDGVCATIHDFMISDGSTIDYQEALERRKRLSEERSADSEVISDHFWTPCD